MNDLLTNPLIQSAVLPLMLAAVLSYVIDKLMRGGSGLGVLIAFYVSALIITGIQLWPLTSVRKILLLGLVMTLVVIIVYRFQVNDRMRRVLWLGIALLSTLWILWPLLARQQVQLVWLQILGAVGYVAWLLLATGKLSNHSIRPAVAVMMLALATSVLAIGGATAMIGQLAAVIAAAIGAVIMTHSLRLVSLPRFDFFLPLLIMTALLGVSATAYARLPVVSLMCLLMLPLVMRFVPSLLRPYLIDRPWLQAIYYALLSSPVIAVAVYLAQDSGEVMSY